MRRPLFLLGPFYAAIFGAAVVGQGVGYRICLAEAFG
jgi:hypothetical protein